MFGVAAAVTLLGLLAAAAHAGRTQLVRRLQGPRIEREVQALFGPEARVTSVAIDSRWRLVLAATGLRIPGGLTLDVTDARLRGYRSAESIVLESLEGTLRWRSLVAPLTYRVAEKPTAPVDGSLVARGATWRRERGAPPFDLDGTVRIAKNDYAVTATRISCEGATGTGELRGTDGPPRSTLHAEGVGANLFRHLVALVGEHPLTVPASARFQGDLVIEPDFTRRLDLALATETTRLAALLRVSPDGRLDGSKVSGTLSFADALEARIFTGRVLPKPPGEAALDLALGGPLGEWLLAGSARAARVEVGGSRHVVSATDVVAAIEVHARGVRWSGLEASVLGGRLRGSGTLDGANHASEVRIEGVRVEDLPLATAEPLLRGLASVRLAVHGRLSDDPTRVEGEGEVELAEPEYVFLGKASEQLGSFGLPPLPVRGTRPLTAQIELAGGKVLCRKIEGRVEGMRFTGSVALGADRALAGRIEAHLEERYLARSLLLALPAMFTGEVTVPLDIAGRLGAPRYEADLVGTLGKLVSRNSVTGAIGGIVDGLLGGGLFGDLFGGRRDRRQDDRRQDDRRQDDRRQDDRRQDDRRDDGTAGRADPGRRPPPRS